MSNNNKCDNKCDACMGSGILTATLVKDTREGVDYKVRIDATICAEDFDASEKTIAEMEKAARLPVNVVGAKKPESAVSN